MAISITCPHCGAKTRLDEPYPIAGAHRQCSCGRGLTISYPVGIVELLKGRGARFEGDDPPTKRRAGPPPDPTASAIDWKTAPTQDARPERPVNLAEPVRFPAPRPSPTARPAPSVRPAPSSRPAPEAPIGAPPPPPAIRSAEVGSAPPRADAGVPAPPPAASPRRVPPPPQSAPRVDLSLDQTTIERYDRAAPEQTTVPKAPVPTRAAPPASVTAPPPPPRPRRRWLVWTARFFAFGLLGIVMLIVLGVAAVLGGISYFSQDLPSVEVLGAYRPPTVTTVYGQDDTGNRVLIGELYQKRRYVVPVEVMPRVVKEAFVAAEDGGFWTHEGIDTIGIIRAVVVNTAEGRKAQGASTITQQVARNFLLSNEKTYERKIREMLLAQRIEQTFTKEHILFLYLNEIYLGSGAYGVEAASRVYYGKSVTELDLAEASLLAGLPQRPSDYSPHKNFEKAKERQSYVLGQMLKNGVIDQAQHDAAMVAPIIIRHEVNEFTRRAPWFSEHVRRYLVDKYGEDKVYNDGLEVETTCNPRLQQEAQRAVTEAAQALDERHGWRGPVEHLEEDKIAGKITDLGKKLDGLSEGERYLGVVTEVQAKHAIVDFGAGKAVVPLAWTRWAKAKGKGKGQLEDMRKTLARGDVVKVNVLNLDYRATKAGKDDSGFAPGTIAAGDLFQPPLVESALFSYRLDDGAVVAMVGGTDFLDTQFNRAIQAQRQVGSTFKPIVYAAAINSRRYTAATIVADAPIVFDTPQGQWKPENYGGDYLGNITIRRALALSRNVVTVRIMDGIGVKAVYDTARRLGITSPMEQALAMGLGAADLNMPELSRAYSSFATLGRKVDYHFVNRVVDRDGTELERWIAPKEWPQVLDPGVATVMNYLLTEVTTAGTAAKASALGLHVAGKTGTTNENKDAWFVGYTPSLLTSVWVGYDQPRSLGADATGGYTALPIWMDFMKAAVPQSADRPFAEAGVEWHGINEATGTRMEGGRKMPFLPGTVPEAVVVEGLTTSQDLLTTEF